MCAGGTWGAFTWWQHAACTRLPWLSGPAELIGYESLTVAAQTQIDEMIAAAHLPPGRPPASHIPHDRVAGMCHIRCFGDAAPCGWCQVQWCVNCPGGPVANMNAGRERCGAGAADGCGRGCCGSCYRKGVVREITFEGCCSTVSYCFECFDEDDEIIASCYGDPDVPPPAKYKCETCGKSGHWRCPDPTPADPSYYAGGPSRLGPKDDEEPAFGTDKKKARQLSIAEALGGGQKKQRE